MNQSDKLLKCMLMEQFDTTTPFWMKKISFCGFLPKVNLVQFDFLLHKIAISYDQSVIIQFSMCKKSL